MRMNMRLEELDKAVKGSNNKVMLINRYHGPLPAEVLLVDNTNKEDK